MPNKLGSKKTPPELKTLYKYTLGRPFLAGTILIFGCWIGCAIFPKFIGWDNVKAGTFGDSFGVMNSLMSGLTVLGVGATIYLQRIELSKSKKDLVKTHNIMLQQATAASTSAELAALTSLLNHYNQQVQYNQNMIESNSNDRNTVSFYHNELNRNMSLRDRAAQLIRIKLSQASLPDFDFDWGVIPKKERNWLIRFCLTLLRDLQTLVDILKPAVGEEPPPYINEPVLGKCWDMIAELRTLATQDGIRHTSNGTLVESLCRECSDIAANIGMGSLRLDETGLKRIAQFTDESLLLERLHSQNK